MFCGASISQVEWAGAKFSWHQLLDQNFSNCQSVFGEIDLENDEVVGCFSKTSELQFYGEVLGWPGQIHFCTPKVWDTDKLHPPSIIFATLGPSTFEFCWFAPFVQIVYQNWWKMSSRLSRVIPTIYLYPPSNFPFVLTSNLDWGCKSTRIKTSGPQCHENKRWGVECQYS